MTILVINGRNLNFNRTQIVDHYEQTFAIQLRSNRVDLESSLQNLIQERYEVTGFQRFPNPHPALRTYAVTIRSLSLVSQSVLLRLISERYEVFGLEKVEDHAFAQVA